MPCKAPLQGFKDPVTGGFTFSKRGTTGEKMTVACGGCLMCRLQRSRHWAARIMHEASLHDDNCFITLTYDEDKMPRLWTGGPGTLVKEHFQKFMKRLRKRYPHKVRYYQCGEYGENLQRPHYHAIIFGLQFDDFQQVGFSNDVPIYTSEILSDIWGYGFVTVGTVTYESAAYCARYCLKKVNGKGADEHYLRTDDYGVAYWLEPEYTTMSRRPGIARDWYEKYGSDVHPSDEIPEISQGGVIKGVPRYYDKLLEQLDPETLAEVKESRKEFLKEHKEDYTPERLEQRYKVKKAQINMLKRGLENE